MTRMRQHGASAALAVGAVLVSVLAAAPASAQNGYSFLDSARSAVAYAQAATKPQLPCRDLRSLAGGDVSIIAAEVVAAADGVPEHCRVSGVIAPEVRFEVNLPAAWNRRFYMIGNGGFAGESPEAPPRAAARANALRNGFVMASTNTGHDAAQEPLATFAAGNLAKQVDYAFRAVHRTATTAKRIAARYYDRPVAYAYWDGCSTGGRQALISAQRFPGDFDGIIAGAPVLNFVDTTINGLWLSKALDAAPISHDKLKVVADAVFAKCDKVDGLADGLVDDPRRCDFDPVRDLPKCAAGADAANCVTEAQAQALRKVYAGPVSGGKPYFFGMPIGAEKEGTPLFGPPTPVSGWDGWIVTRSGDKSRQLLYAESFIKHMAFGKSDPNFDWKAFDYDKDPARTGEIRRMLNATDPDLSAFRNRGGKLLMYFGWADPALTPFMGVDYYEKALAANGPETRSFFRLFMVPGMFHCRGGVGPDRFDALTALVNWVENGAAPDRLVATQMEQGQLKRSRPLCPYPQVARYTGSGGVDDAANFACRDPG